MQNGHTKYNWRLSELEPTAIVEQLQSEPVSFTDELPFANDVRHPPRRSRSPSLIRPSLPAA
jgi:hypothetical protein